MLVIIETNGANHIAINVPVGEAEKALPALVNLFERNAIFYNSGYASLEEVTPKISIQIGNKYQFDKGGQEIVVQTEEASAFLTNDFIALSPEIFLSNKKIIDEKDAECRSLRNKVQVLEEDIVILKQLTGD
jgi:hypothetical protein